MPNKLQDEVSGYIRRINSILLDHEEEKNALTSVLKGLSDGEIDNASLSRFKEKLDDIIYAFQKRNGISPSSEFETIIRALRNLSIDFEETVSRNKEDNMQETKPQNGETKENENQERDLKKEIEEEERIIGELEAKIPFYEGDPKDLKAELSAHKDKKEEMVAYYNSGVEAAKGYKEKSIRAIVEKIKTGEQPAISGYHSTKGDIKIAFFDSPINKKAHIAFSEKALKNMQENPDNNIAVIDNKENVFYVSKKEIKILKELFGKSKGMHVNQFDIESKEAFENVEKENEVEENPFA